MLDDTAQFFGRGLGRDGAGVDLVIRLAVESFPLLQHQLEIVE